MLKLKPIAEEVLHEAEDVVTWGDVKRLFQVLKSTENKEVLKKNLSKLGRIGINFATAGIGQEIFDYVVTLAQEVENPKDISKAIFSISKLSSESQLKSPKDSKFKKLTGPFWDAIKLDPRVSLILDDKIETEFLNTVIYPQLQVSNNDSEPIPNMNYELGKWLNEKGLKTPGNEADIFFKGKSQEI